MSAVGFHLFKKFLKGSGYGHFADFLSQVAVYRSSPFEVKLILSSKIISTFLVDGSAGITSRQSVLKEAYMFRELPPETTARADSIPDADSSNILRVSGESVDEIFEITKLPRQKEEWIDDPIAAVAPEYLFDSLDLTIFNFLKKKLLPSFQQSEEWFKMFKLIEYSSRPVKADNFLYFRALGRGGFGLVKACKHKQTGKMFAAKVMDKRRIKAVDSADLILEELAVMTMVDSPYVVCLKYAFATPQDVYLILDLMTGGDLGFHLLKRGSFSPEECRYYTARVCLAIGALHDLDIVYRDLKPENILLDEFGYSKLSDFGLASRMRKNGLAEACGTRGYWAPEMLQRDPDGRKVRYFLSVDWFSLGCVLYEFILGVGPFRTDKARAWAADGKRSKEECMDLATLQMEPEFDDRFEPLAVDLIQKLMTKDPKHRLGCNGYLEVLEHPYFKTIDWQHMDMIRPPFR